MLKKFMFLGLVLIMSLVGTTSALASPISTDPIGIEVLSEGPLFSHYRVDEADVTHAVFSEYPGDAISQFLRDKSIEVDIDSAALPKIKAESISSRISATLSEYLLDANFGPTPDFHQITLDCPKTECGRVSALLQAENIAQYVQVFENEQNGLVDQANQLGGLSFEGHCTGAFIGYRFSQLGVLTARHCFVPDTVVFYGGTVIQGTIFSPYPSIDLVFVPLLGASNGYVRTGGGIFEPMAGGRDPIIGEKVCHFGITTGRTCTKILAVNQVVTYDGVICRLLAATTDVVTEPGDSGGPWFTDTPLKNALGVHTGTLYVAGVLRSGFTIFSASNSLDIDFIFAGIQ